MAGLWDRLRRRAEPEAGPGILVVDDDPGVRTFLKVLLEQEGLGPFYEAPDGEVAIKLAYKKRPRLLILDYHMPKANGEAVARSVKLFSPGARIILFSSIIDEPVDWADAFVAKDDVDRLPAVLRTQSLLLIAWDRRGSSRTREPQNEIRIDRRRHASTRQGP